jgi:Ca2+-binding EF-hand superfamily protein
MLQQAKEKMEPLQKPDTKQTVAEKLATDVELITEQGKESIKKVQEFMKENGSKMRLPADPAGVELGKQIAVANNKASGFNKELDNIIKESKTLQTKIKKKAEATKKNNSNTAKFIKYDKNKDQHFSKVEAKAYANGEFKFKVSDDALNNIFAHWAKDPQKGIHKDSFQRLKVGIGMARELAKDAERKKEREEKEAKVEKLKEEAKGKIEEATQGINETEEAVKKPEAHAQPLLGKSTKMEKDEMIKEADEVEKLVTEAKDQIGIAKEALKGLLEDIDEDLRPWMVQEVKKIEMKTKNWDARVAKATTIATKLRQMCKAKEQMENEALEAKAFAIIRYHQQQEKMDADALFAAADSDKDGKVSQDEFVAFVAGCKRPPRAKKEGEEGDETEPAPPEEELKKVFEFLDYDGSGSMSKGRFQAVSAFRVKVVIKSPMTKELAVSSEAVRSLDKGEVLEVIDGPMDEPEGKMRRVKAKAMKDGAEGYVTMGGNGTTTFLREWQRLYKIVKETLLTDDFDLDSMEEGKSRKLKIGELVQVMENPVKDEKTGMMRMRCKAKTDGRLGWATTQGNAGTMFMEAA